MMLPPKSSSRFAVVSARLLSGDIRLASMKAVVNELPLGRRSPEVECAPQQPIKGTEHQGTELL